MIVGPDDGGVAPGVAAAEIALFEHRDIRDAMFLGQVVCGRKAVSACADDNDLIGFPRLGVTPGARPVSCGQQAHDGEA